MVIPTIRPSYSRLASLVTAVAFTTLAVSALHAPVAMAQATPLPFSAASTPLASQVLEQQWAGMAQQTPEQASDKSPAPRADRRPLDWRYSFVSTPLIRQQMASKANRLSAEIGLIAARYDVAATPGSPSARYVTALHEWERYLDQGRDKTRSDNVMARLPGQLDPRRDIRDGPQAIRIAPGMVIGACQAPDSILIMDASGVHQRQWRPNLTLDALIDERSDADALGDASHVSLVTPQGQVLTRPIAVWNRLTRGDADLPIAPGASIVINTPGIDTAQQWVNQVLPEWLASRLPGHDCQSWQLDAATLPAASAPSAAMPHS